MRLFLALWPDSAAAAALGALAAELATLAGGKPVVVAKIHLTLVFLGDVVDARLEEAVGALAGLRRPGMKVALDQVGSFRGARVAWAGCRRVDPALVALQADLRQRLALRGFAIEERAFVPHVTLVRKVGRPLARQASEPIRWQAREVTLVRSELGKGSYSTLARWELG